MIIGKLIDVWKHPSEEWQRKHCLGYLKRNEKKEFVWDEAAFQAQLKYTHGGCLECGNCKKKPCITRLTKDNISGADPIQCILCKEINIVV